MLVRMLIGRSAGEVVDVVSQSARQMLADGRAEDVHKTAPVKRRRGRPPKNKVEPDGVSS